MLRNPLNQIEDPGQKKLVRFRLIIAAVVISGVLLCSALILGGLALQGAAEAPERATQQASFDSVLPLKDLCAGGAGQAAAAAYTPGAGPHRLVVFRNNLPASSDLSAFYIRTDDYPEPWRAALLEDAALVACIGTGSVVVEECAYTLDDGRAATLRRVQLTAVINVYTARTGERVGQGELPGAAPRACQDTEQFTEGLDTAFVTGQPPSPAAIAEWLRAYVE